MAGPTARAERRGKGKLAKGPTEAEQIVPKTLHCQPIPVDAIRLRAYLKWEAAGRPAGDDVRFWLEAERELLSGK
jgi:hypothetical protein